jgi:predicted deacylase
VTTPQALIRSRCIKGGVAGPRLLLTAGVHGDEFEGMLAIRRLGKLISPDQLRGTVTLVAVVNEAAFLRGQRTADDGLDLARQCPGDPSGSITRRIAHELSALIREADYYIDLHSGGTAMCVAPLAGYTLHPDAQVLESQRRMARAFNLPLVWGTSPTLEGRSLSVARDANVPAIYAEYLGSGVCSKQGVEDYVDGCLNVMNELNIITRLPPPVRLARVVEDSRPGSGHLQVAHPSPITGYFEPAVKLYDEVGPRQLLGTVASLGDEELHEVFAEHAGVVICIATFPRVLEGSGLVVILESQR